MAKNPPEGSPNIFPALRYKNAAAALEWLGRAFGFEKQMVVPGPEGTIAHAQMKLGPGVIMLGSGKHGPGTDNPGTLRSRESTCTSRTWTRTTRAPRPRAPRS